MEECGIEMVRKKLEGEQTKGDIGEVRVVEAKEEGKKEIFPKEEKARLSQEAAEKRRISGVSIASDPRDH